MNFELQKLFEFQGLLAEMMQRVIEMRLKKIPEETLQPAIERIDKLIEIYKTFDRFYYQAHFNSQKILQIESEKLVMAEKIKELEKENEKLLNSLQWK